MTVTPCLYFECTKDLMLQGLFCKTMMYMSLLIILLRGAIFAIDIL